MREERRARGRAPFVCCFSLRAAGAWAHPAGVHKVEEGEDKRVHLLGRAGRAVPTPISYPSESSACEYPPLSVHTPQSPKPTGVRSVMDCLMIATDASHQQPTYARPPRRSRPRTRRARCRARRPGPVRGRANRCISGYAGRRGGESGGEQVAFEKRHVVFFCRKRG